MSIAYAAEVEGAYPRELEGRKRGRTERRNAAARVVIESRIDAVTCSFDHAIEITSRQERGVFVRRSLRICSDHRPTSLIDQAPRGILIQRSESGHIER